jgi:hypothetical protein
VEVKAAQKEVRLVTVRVFHPKVSRPEVVKKLHQL